MRRIFESVLHPAHLRRTGLIAFLVGTWLTAFNQGDVILAGGFDFGVIVKITLNYFTPFVVANLGLLSRETEEKEKDNG